MYMITEYITAVVKIVADYKDCMKKLRRGKTPDYINIKKFTINIKTQERQMLLKQIFNTRCMKLLLFIC